MRVISGKYRGKRLEAPEGYEVRPTMDRIKETIFNIIQFRIESKTVLDLFAGTGALGIEAISRGAAEVVFIDTSSDSINCIKNNLKKIDGNYKVIKTDFSNYLLSLGKKFDIIFIDPPYKSLNGEEAIKIIIERRLLSDDGIIVFERSSDHETDYEALLGDMVDLFAVRNKKMGPISADLIEWK